MAPSTRVHSFDPPARWAIGRALFARGCVRHHEATLAGRVLICDGDDRQREHFARRAERLSELASVYQPVAVVVGHLPTGAPYRIERRARRTCLAELLDRGDLASASSFQIALQVALQLRVLHRAGLTHGALSSLAVSVGRRRGAHRVWLSCHTPFDAEPHRDLRQLGLLLREIAAECRWSEVYGGCSAIEVALDSLVNEPQAWTAERVLDVLVENPLGAAPPRPKAYELPAWMAVATGAASGLVWCLPGLLGG
ncbi:MAG: hypothetical protein GY913_11315 [Proteobacteria bacterium]|nr:hypothetical protein [Pseudomonadota bacterium]MCP4917503.1 hypothetical protein [Pseudomonadota bacterium]